MFRHAIAAAALAGLLATGAAKADPTNYYVSGLTNGLDVTIIDSAVGIASGVSALKTGESGLAGQILLVPGNPSLSLDAWCVDIAADLYLGSTYAFTQTGPVLATPTADDALTTTTAKQVGALIQHGSAEISTAKDATPTQIAASAAVQVAIWAIEYGDGTAKITNTGTTLTDGGISVTSNTDVISLANTYIQNVTGTNPKWTLSPSQQLVMLTEPGTQNLVFLTLATLSSTGNQNTDLPEPASMAVLLFGLAGLAAVRNRRRAKPTA